MNKIATYFILLFCVFLVPKWSKSQFTRHWNESFSTKAALLSGAVVGGFADETSIYYNPSILRDSSESSFTFSNGLVKIDLVRYENAMGTGLNVYNWEPSIASGFLSVGLYPKDKFGLVWKAAIFNKTNFDNSFSGEHRTKFDVYENIPGDEQYLGKISSRREYNDYWYGIGVAKFFNTRFSVGVSFFARYSNLRYTAIKNIKVTALDTTDDSQIVSVNNSSSSLRGYCWRGTVKIGANYILNEKIKLGLVVTTPSMFIVGSAEASSNISYVNVLNLSNTEFLPDYLYDEVGSNLGFKIKDPISIAAGIDYTANRYRWNLTMEWFAGLKPYRLVDEREGDIEKTLTENVVEQDEFLSYSAGGHSIFNIAIGLEKFLPNNRSWLFGFKTDFDALDQYDYGELASLNKLLNAKTDYYHFSAGKSFSFLNFDVLFGIEYSFSRAKNLPGFANFAPPIEVGSETPYKLEGAQQNNMNYRGDALILFVGLTLRK
jgi:hypothetical protein